MKFEDLTPKTVEKFLKALEQKASYYDFDVRRKYQGRAMYGRTCIGIVTEYQAFSVAVSLMEIINSIQDIDENERQTLIESLRNTSIDNMGLDKIYYFRDISLDEQK